MPLEVFPDLFLFIFSNRLQPLLVLYLCLVGFVSLMNALDLSSYLCHLARLLHVLECPVELGDDGLLKSLLVLAYCLLCVFIRDVDKIADRYSGQEAEADHVVVVFRCDLVSSIQRRGCLPQCHRGVLDLRAVLDVCQEEAATKFSVQIRRVADHAFGLGRDFRNCESTGGAKIARSKQAAFSFRLVASVRIVSQEGLRI